MSAHSHVCRVLCWSAGLVFCSAHTLSASSFSFHGAFWCFCFRHACYFFVNFFECTYRGCVRLGSSTILAAHGDTAVSRAVCFVASARTHSHLRSPPMMQLCVMTLFYPNSQTWPILHSPAVFFYPNSQTWPILLSSAVVFFLLFCKVHVCFCDLCFFMSWKWCFCDPIFSVFWSSCFCDDSIGQPNIGT